MSGRFLSLGLGPSWADPSSREAQKDRRKASRTLTLFWVLCLGLGPRYISVQRAQPTGAAWGPAEAAHSPSSFKTGCGILLLWPGEEVGGSRSGWLLSAASSSPDQAGVVPGSDIGRVRPIFAGVSPLCREIPGSSMTCPGLPMVSWVCQG